MRISKNEPKTRAAVEKYREENDMSYIGDQMRAAYLKSRGRAADREQQNKESREEYAADRVTDSAETIGRETVYHGRRAVNHAKHNYGKQTYRTTDRSVPFHGGARSAERVQTLVNQVDMETTDNSSFSSLILSILFNFSYFYISVLCMQPCFSQNI